MTYDEIYECWGAAVETYGELVTQYKSECALYGDAWPGAAIDVQEAEERLRKIEADLDAYPTT